MYFIADDFCVMHVYFSAMWRRAGVQGRVCVVGECFAYPQLGVVGNHTLMGRTLTASGLYAPTVCRIDLVY